MSWNYRVIKQLCPITQEWWYGIHEVYYAEDGSLSGYSDAAVIGETPKVLGKTLKMMKRSLEEPMLSTEEFKSE